MAKQDPNNNYKVKRGLGGAVTRQRRRAADGVRADKDAFWASNRNAAIDELARNQREFENRAEMLRKRFIRGIFNSTISNSTAVTRSRGLTTSVRAHVTENWYGFSAYTDFSAITINWPEKMLPKSDTDHSAVLDSIAQIRGVYFHEEGHIRYTVPFTQVSNSVYNSAQTPEYSDYTLVKTWNILEDQRMECAVVADVPRMSTYFTPMALKILLQQDDVGKNGNLNRAYILVAGRTYVAANVRQECAKAFDKLCDGYNVPNGAATWFDIVSRYKAAATNADLYSIVVEAYKFLWLINDTTGDGYGSGDGKGDHTRQRENPNATPDKGATPTDPSDAPSDASPSDTTDEGEGDASEDKSDADEGDADGDADGDEGDDANSSPSPTKDTYGDDSGKPVERRDGEERDETSTPSEGNQSNHGDGSHIFSKDTLTQAIEEAIAGANSAVRNDTEVLDIFDNLGSYDTTSSLPEYDGYVIDMTDAELSHADDITVGIQNALETYVSASSPQWRTHQERGAIQPLQYRTKEIGSQEFHRYLEGNGNTGLDLHVSILADASGSMAYHMTELSQFMYAARNACESLGIGITQSLWSSESQNYRIWSSGPKPEVFPAMGGTEPTMALDDLATHNPEGANNHLVLVFTDGEWSYEFPSLARWSAPGRSIMLIRYGGTSDKGMGADTHISINRVSELGEQLTYGISDVLASSSH